MHLILTGATGLVGGAVLSHILSLPPSVVSCLSILSRKPVSMAASANDPRVNVITHSDFTSYPPEVLDKLKGAHGVIWALGISQSEVSKEEYVTITKDYTMAAAKAFASISNTSEGKDSKFNFVYVSGEGATLNPGMLTPLFGRVKGETEQGLVDLAKNPEYNSLRIYNARPAAVDPSDDPPVLAAHQASGKRTGLKYSVMEKVMMPVVKACYANMHSPTKDLSKALTDLAMSDGEPLQGKGVEAEGRTITNQGLRRMTGLAH